jgi:hypothetical protein
MTLTELEAQVIREAGHAVVAHFLNFRIVAVQWETTGARIYFEGTFDNPRSEQEAANALIVQVAGYAAMQMAGVRDDSRRLSALLAFLAERPHIYAKKKKLCLWHKTCQT